MLGAWLSPLSVSERQDKLGGLQQGSWPLALSNRPPSGLSEAQQAQLARGEVVTRLSGEQLSISFVYQLPDGSQWIEAGPETGAPTCRLTFNCHC